MTQKVYQALAHVLRQAALDGNVPLDKICWKSEGGQVIENLTPDYLLRLG